MKYQFLNFFLERKDLLKQNSDMIDPFLLENNKDQLDSFYDFYKEDTPMLFINGFMGTGKKQLVNYSLNFLSKESLVLWYNCFETTILDDILLMFFNEFKKLQTQGVISPLKTKTENFTAKINAYFTSIEKPIVIILNSFDSIQKENTQEIVDFINHVIGFDKIKIIIVSRTLDRKLFTDDSKYERITLSALDKGLFEKYLKQKKISLTSSLLEDLYKHTRGYYFYTSITASILKYKNIDVKDFMENFKLSFLSYNKYLEKEVLDIIPAISVQFFWLLCLLRHGVTTQILKQLHYYNEENIEFLTSNQLLIQNNGLIFVHDYFREQMDISIPDNVAQKLHKFIIDFYESQLPLKPLERGVLLSRQTIRNEIEYHTLFLPRKTEVNPNAYKAMARGLDYDLSRLKQNRDNTNQDSAERQPDSQSNHEENKQNKPDYISTVTPNVSNIDINLNNLPFKLTEDELKLLNISTPNKNVSERMQSSINIDVRRDDAAANDEVQQEETTDSLSYYLKLAKSEESKYNYKLACELYKKALTFSDDEQYKVLLPKIYTKLAFACHKLSEIDNALKYYNLAKDCYAQSDEKIKENYIKLSIANVYYETYKLDLAKSMLLEIVNSQGNPHILTTKTYIALANIEDSLSNTNAAYDYYKNALELSNTTMDTETLSELYFKYALISDDKNDITTAIEYYEKCININRDPKVNKFLSSAYSNIATLYLEKNDNAIAVKNFLQAYQIDEANQNFDGMYFSATKLAQIMQRKLPEKAVFYFKKAKECAVKLNDIFYHASSLLAFGDFYYSQKQDALALNEYFTALDLVKNEFSKDNINKIEMRINDIKFRLGHDKFAVIENEYKFRKAEAEAEKEQQNNEIQ
ncbi:hypothetical protein IJ818_04515 [bacterium]|nr:hypothetical protein [bacterium]